MSDVYINAVNCLMFLKRKITGDVKTRVCDNYNLVEIHTKRRIKLTNHISMYAFLVHLLCRCYGRKTSYYDL